MSVSKIVLTGGPCSGKTSALEHIIKEVEKTGYKVFFVPEVVTGLTVMGASPQVSVSIIEYEKRVLDAQLFLEETIEQLAKNTDADKVLIVCDRGTMDIEAYIGKEMFGEVMSLAGTNSVQLKDDYDAVFHMVTTAYGAEEYYTLENNAARTEGIEAARELDDKLVNAWVGHPHLRIIDNSTDFQGKIDRLLKEILSFLGEPEPVEIERKFLIEYPDKVWLESLPNCKKVGIVQTYISNEAGNEVRIRQRGYDGNFSCFYTMKTLEPGIKRMEKDWKITKDEYLELLMDADFSKRVIRKDRYCLVYEGQYLEIDVYPFWDDKAILEIELCDENAEVKIPDKIKVIEDVTDVAAYKNINLADSAPLEY